MAVARSLDSTATTMARLWLALPASSHYIPESNSDTCSTGCWPHRRRPARWHPILAAQRLGQRRVKLALALRLTCRSCNRTSRSICAARYCRSHRPRTGPFLWLRAQAWLKIKVVEIVIRQFAVWLVSGVISGVQHTVTRLCIRGVESGIEIIEPLRVSRVV